MNKILLQNERLYLSSPSINVCFRVIIEEILEKKNLEKALEMVCIRHPFLNSFVEIDNDNNAWLVQKTDIINIEWYKSDDMNFLDWYKKTDNIPFSFSKGPLIKFCIIEDKNTEIIILGHHIIGDGIGYLNLIKDIISALDGNIDTTPQIPPFAPTDKYFKDTVLLDHGVVSFAKGLNEEWKQSRISFSENDYLTFFDQYRNRFVPNLYLNSIQGELFNNLLEKCKTYGLSVNEMIASIFSLAFMETLNKKNTRFGIAANIRNELVSEPNNCMGNYITGISAKAYYEPSNNILSNINTITGLIREQLLNNKNKHLVVHFLNEFDKDFIESIMFAAYGDTAHPVSKKLAELIGEQLENKGIGFSNLGKCNFENSNNFKIIDFQFIGPAFPANLLTVGVITFNNKLSLCFRFNDTEINIDKIKTIYEKGIELLKKL